MKNDKIIGKISKQIIHTTNYISLINIRKKYSSEYTKNIINNIIDIKEKINNNKDTFNTYTYNFFI